MYAIKVRPAGATARFWLAYARDPRNCRYFLSGPAPALGFHDLSNRVGRARLMDNLDDAQSIAAALAAREQDTFEVVRIGNGVHRVGGHL